MPEIDYAVFTDHSELLAQAAEEMQRQLRMWGEQKHPMLHSISDPSLPLDVADQRVVYGRSAQWRKNDNDARAVDGELGWDGILLEEVFEAFAEDDPAKAVTELVQVAAVALSAARSIQRYGLGGKAVAL